ncbi:hypothetical protein LEMLEM_LOCUS22989 [Lemmus lemmus]
MVYQNTRGRPGPSPEDSKPWFIRGLDCSQACINFCFGYSVFLETHLQAIINSLECWQNIQTCRQASDDTTLGKSSGSWPDSEEGEEERKGCSRERREEVLAQLFPLCHPSVWTSGPHCQQECSVGGHLSRSGERKEHPLPGEGIFRSLQFYPGGRKESWCPLERRQGKELATDSPMSGQLQAAVLRSHL